MCETHRRQRSAHSVKEVCQRLKNTATERCALLPLVCSFGLSIKDLH
uniref:Uncharacterized protein n=1 Tax=Anguilla anguilla TaxID=7936 RepID=A0A0E9VLF1_ANGAN